MQSKLQAFGQTLASILNIGNVVHYWHPVTDRPYLIWFETGEADSFEADNTKAEMLIQISVEYWTRDEFDAKVDTLQAWFSSQGPWTLDSVLYEEDTNLIHYSWTLEVAV